MAGWTCPDKYWNIWKGGLKADELKIENDIIGGYFATTDVQPFTNKPIALFVEDGVTPEQTVLSTVNKGIAIQADGAAYYSARDVTNDIEFVMGTSNQGVGFFSTMTDHRIEIRPNNQPVHRFETGKYVGAYNGVSTLGPHSLVKLGCAINTGNIAIGMRGSDTSFQYYMFGSATDSYIGGLRYDCSTDTMDIQVANAAQCTISATTFDFKDNELHNEKFKITNTGAYCIKLTNKTGSNTVAGQIVKTLAGVGNPDDAVALAGVSELHPIGVFLESGVTDGSEAWIVVSGIVNVLVDAGGCARGDRLITGAIGGFATVNNAPSVAVHFQEIGHCIETRAGAGLARAVLHFN